jgi:ATPase family associated with various cellular activities (AAA)
MTALPREPRTLPTQAEQARPALLEHLARIKRLLIEGEASAEPAVSAGPDSVQRLRERLALSRFETDLLLLVAGVELDAELAQLVAEKNAGDARPTFALALAVFPDAHWDALTPDRPLRRWGLLELGPGPHLTSRPLTVDEQVLHHLTGLAHTDSSLDGLVRRSAPVGPLTASQRATADELAATASALRGHVLIRLEGADVEGRRGVAHRVAELLGHEVIEVRDGALAEHALTRAARALDREARLADRVPLTDHPGLLSLLDCPLVISTADAEGSAVSGERRTVLSRSCPLPDVDEQLAIWEAVLPDAPDDVRRVITDISHHYRLPARAIEALAAEWSATPSQTTSTTAAPAPELRRLARERSRVGLGALAERIESTATIDDLVLPAGQKQLLLDLGRQLTHRSQVYDDWGFAEKSARGLGVTALFAGESGTGKTMAAEVIARALDLDLYRVDLSAVVSKYIGETEKNLRLLLDAAESSGSVLLFDEADALFGRRSEVKDSHDRYANLEVAYLLARMESYRGLAILTTNLGANLDRAFMRRLRFVIQFPFPDEVARAEIWRHTLPDRVPREGLDFAALARLQVSGGSIRAIALTAAFAAAADGTPIRPEHILRAATIEYAKAERSLTANEIAGLVGSQRGVS